MPSFRTASWFNPPCPPQIRQSNYPYALRISVSYLGRVPGGREGSFVPKGNAHLTGCDHRVMVEVDALRNGNRFRQRDIGDASALQRDHAIKPALRRDPDRLRPVTGRQPAVEGRWRAAALQMSQDGDACFEALLL